MNLRSAVTLPFLGFLAVSALGCVTRYRLDVPHETALPSLDGARVAVLPAFASPGAEGSAIIGRRVSEAAFCAPIGGIEFLAPSRTLHEISASDHALADLRESLSGVIRGKSEPASKRGPWLFHGDRAGTVALRRAIDVSMARRPPTSSAWVPTTIARETFEGIPAQFVLVSIAFAEYQQVTAVTALAGVIPYFWSQDLQGARPTSLFVLYETATGRPVWEAVVSVSGRIADDDPRYAREVVDSRMMPYLGAAQLLTGEFEQPFIRVLEAQAAARLGSVQGSPASGCAQLDASTTAP